MVTLTAGGGTSVNVQSGGAAWVYSDGAANMSSLPGLLLKANGTGDVPRLRFQNSTTGGNATDGSFVGISNTDQLDVWNFENSQVRIGVNNAAVATLDATKPDLILGQI